MKMSDAGASDLGLSAFDLTDNGSDAFAFTRRMLAKLYHPGNPAGNYLTDIDLLRRENELMSAQLAVLEKVLSEIL